MASKQQDLRKSIKQACTLSICNTKYKTKQQSKHEPETDISEKIKLIGEKEKILKNKLNTLQSEKFKLIIEHTGQDAYDLASRE